MSSKPISIAYQDWLRYFEVTRIKIGSLPEQPALSQQETLYRLYITPSALCFGRVGDVIFAQELEAQYDHIQPSEPAFLEIDPFNFSLSLVDIQRIVLDRRPHLHNPLNGGSLTIWVKPGRSSLPEYTFLLNYTTDADQLLEELRAACQSAGMPLPEVHEDPALRITTPPLHIQLQWQRGMGLVLLAFSVCWSSLITYLTAILVSMYPFQPGIINGAVIVSLLLFLLAGLFLFYYSLTHILNYTILSLVGSSLHIRAGPLPWAGTARRVVISPDDEIFINTRRLEHWNEYPSITTYVYDLIAASPEAPPRRLISLSRLPHAMRVQKAMCTELKQVS